MKYTSPGPAALREKDTRERKWGDTNNSAHAEGPKWSIGGGDQHFHKESQKPMTET